VCCPHFWRERQSQELQHVNRVRVFSRLLFLLIVEWWLCGSLCISPSSLLHHLILLIVLLLDACCFLLLSFSVEDDLLISPDNLSSFHLSFLDLLDPLGFFSGPILDNLLLLVKFKELYFKLAHRFNLIFVIDLNICLLHDQINLRFNLVNSLLVGSNVNDVLDQGWGRTSNCLAVVSHWGLLFLILRLVAHKELVFLLHQSFRFKLCLDVVFLILQFLAHFSNSGIAFLLEHFKLFLIVLAQIDVEKVSLLNSEKMLD
jgi:hypothetical protein